MDGSLKKCTQNISTITVISNLRDFLYFADLLKNVCKQIILPLTFGYWDIS